MLRRYPAPARPVNTSFRGDYLVLAAPSSRRHRHVGAERGLDLRFGTEGGDLGDREPGLLRRQLERVGVIEHLSCRGQDLQPAQEVPLAVGPSQARRDDRATGVDRRVVPALRPGLGPVGTQHDHAQLEAIAVPLRVGRAAGVGEVADGRAHARVSFL